jgi:glycosyltransferase involved in cell wall biosynthesis
MKICLMTSVYALSETDRNGSFLVESTRHLLKDGHEVHVFAPSYESCPSHVVHGVPVYRFRYFFKPWENLTHGQGAPTRIRNPLYLFVAAFYVLFGLLHAIQFCRRHAFDVIHVHWPFPHGIWGYVAGKLSRTPMVLTFHGAEVLLAKRFFFVKYFLQHALRHASGVICNSTYTAKEVSRFSDKAPHVIPFGSTVTVRPSRKDHNRPEKEILFAGRLIQRKGLDVLIRAIPLISQDVSVNLHVVGDGPMAHAWQELSRRLGIASKVIFHGVVSNADLESRYASADVFVLPAIVDEQGDTEGLGIVLIEALSFMTPVIASDVGGISDIVIHRKTGLLVPQKDPQALAQALLALLTDKELANKTAEAGSVHVQEYFNWDRITHALAAVYRQAAPSRA